MGVGSSRLRLGDVLREAAKSIEAAQNDWVLAFAGEEATWSNSSPLRRHRTDRLEDGEDAVDRALAAIKEAIKVVDGNRGSTHA